MAMLNLGFVWLVLSALAAHYSLGCKRTVSGANSGPDTRNDGDDVYLCGTCGQSITVQLIVRNNYVSPFFEVNATVKDKPQRELIHFLESAAVQDTQFKFAAEFYGSLGYMITKISGVEASVSNKTYWKTIEHPSGNSLKLGVSSYVPVDNEVIVFNFTTWDTSNA